MVRYQKNMSSDLQQSSTHTKAGNLAQLVSLTNKTYFVRLNPGSQLQTHRGIIKHNDLIGLPWGSEVFSHTERSFFLLQPTLAAVLKETRRNTQIIYPKDIGFILVTMGIGPGTVIVEAGTGSGAFTTALAWAVGPQGRVISYELRSEMQNLAKKNVNRLGLLEQVTFKLRDIGDGFDEKGVDALFLDVPNPSEYLEQVRGALKPGGYFGCILPTFNQVERLIVALHKLDFAFVDICEILLRYYKPVAARLRPTDRMVAHTGYLIFSRPVIRGHLLSGTNEEKQIVEPTEDNN